MRLKVALSEQDHVQGSDNAKVTLVNTATMSVPTAAVPIP